MRVARLWSQESSKLLLDRKGPPGEHHETQITSSSPAPPPPVACTSLCELTHTDLTHMRTYTHLTLLGPMQPGSTGQSLSKGTQITALFMSGFEFSPISGHSEGWSGRPGGEHPHRTPRGKLEHHLPSPQEPVWETQALQQGWLGST